MATAQAILPDREVSALAQAVSARTPESGEGEQGCSDLRSRLGMSR